MPRSRLRVVLLAAVGALLLAGLVVWAHAASEPEAPSEAEFLLLAAAAPAHVGTETAADEAAMSATLVDHFDRVQHEEEPECWRMEEGAAGAQRYFCKVRVEPMLYLWATYLVDPGAGTVRLYRTGDMPVGVLLSS